MDLTDTHCHIHEAQYDLPGDDGVRDKWERAGRPQADDMVAKAANAGVTRLLCVGCTVDDSAVAVDFVQRHKAAWATIGIHPHEAQRYLNDRQALDRFTSLATRPKVVAVGECGLDYFYNHSPKAAQVQILRLQIELALKYDLPLIFHIREAFEEFWPIFDEYRGVRGVVHSFSATKKELDEVLARDLYVGLNGIMTFTKQEEQLEAARAVPLSRLVLETDAPFLTPVPDRGKICEPKHVRLTAKFLSELRNESLEDLAAQTTANARALFGI